ncbi:MAG: hypothetical protein WBY88_03570 [Desulfosarcina sp.]
MNSKANDTFAFDLENRLDDFFSDSLPPQDQPQVDEPSASAGDLPLKDLKSTILAIDWEITDDVLDIFIDQVDGLTDAFEADKVAHTLLRLLKSLGKYIRSHKSKAHPETIKRIMAVYSTLEAAVADDGLSRTEKENMLLEEVRQFKRLKARIAETRAPHPASGSATQPAHSDAIPDLGAVIKAVEALKSLMASELGAIREELGHLRRH